MHPVVKGVPRLLNVNREPSRPKKRRKITLVFDEAKRKEFLTGFHKRKVERKQKAAEQLKLKLKEERKRIKKEAQARFKTLVSQRNVPELEELLSKHEYEADGKTISILELNVENLVKSSHWIGENKPKYENESNSEQEDEEYTSNEEESVPGMELIPKKSKPSKKREEDEPQVSQKWAAKAAQKEIQRQMKRSKVFKRKEQVDRGKNKKLAQRAKRKLEQAIKNAKGKAKSKLLKKKKDK